MPESLKNLLLVMADGGYLKSPTEGEKPSAMWEETWERVDRFLPDLLREVFPETKASEAQVRGSADLPARSKPDAEASEAKRDRPRKAEADDKAREEAAA